MRAVDHGAAVARAGRRVDGVERPQLENVLGVDRVGIAQPVLDLGDRERRRPRVERRLRRGPRRWRLHLGGLVERARPGEISLAALARRVPALLAGDRGEPLHEARGHRRRAGELGRDRLRITSSAPSACAKSCADSPMRRSGRSRPSAWRIGRLSQGSAARLRRPDAFDQPAEHHAVDASAAALRAGRRCARARRAAPGRRTTRSAIAVLEQLGIVGRRDGEAGAASHARCRRTPRELRAVGAGEGGWLAALVGCSAPRRRRDGVRRSRRRSAARADSASSGASAAANRSTSAAGGVELAVAQAECADRTDADRMAPGAETCRARRGTSQAPAQGRAVPVRGRGPRRTARSSAATARACAPSGGAEPHQRMLEQARAASPAARPPSAASAASRANTPAGVSASASPPESSTGTFQRSSAAEHAARQRAVGRHQRRGLARRLHRLAQRDRDGERLLLGVGGLDHRERCERGVDARREIGAGELAARGRSRPPAAAPPTRSARGHARPGRPSASHCVARDADPVAAAPAWRIADGPTAGGSTRGRRHRGGRRSAPTMSASRSVSRPGSTTAPCGSLAMVAISSAVAGIEPVEPAAITGPSVCAASRCRFGLDQRVAARGRLDRGRARRGWPAKPRGRSSGIRA